MATPAPNNIEIQIRVVDAGSAATVQNVRNEIVGLDASTKEVSQSFVQAGVANTAANAALHETQAASAGAGSGLDQVRNKAALVRYEFQEMGIRVPRYLAAELAGVQALTSAMTALSGIFFAVGVFEIAKSGIEGMEHLYHSVLDVNAAFKDYNAEVAKHQKEEFTNTHSIETARDRLRELNREAEHWNDVAQKSNRAGGSFADQAVWAGFDILSGNFGRSKGGAWGALFGEKEARTKEAEARTQADKLREQVREGDHQRRMLDIDAAHAADRELGAWGQIEAKRRRAHEANAEETRYNDERDNVLAPSHRRVSAEERTKNQIADAEASTERLQLSRREREERIRMEDEARNAGLRGEALYLAQRGEAIDAIKRKAEDREISERTALAETAASARRFDQEALKRLDDYRRETEKQAREHASAGLIGLAKTQAEGQGRVQDIYADAESRGGLDYMVEAWKRAGVEKQRTDDELTKQDAEYYEHLQQMRDGWLGGELTGYAQIAAEAKKRADSIRHEFGQMYGGLAADNPLRQKAESQKAADLALSGQKEDRDKLALTRRNADETLRLEEEARRKSLVGMAAQTQQIEDEYAQRVRKYDEMLRAQEISQEDHDRRIIAAGREREAQLQHQAEETRDRLAGELGGFFRNPSEWIKGIGEKAMSRAAADMLMGVPGIKEAAGSKGGLAGSLESGDFLNIFRHRGQKSEQGEELGIPRGSFWSRMLHPGMAGVQAPAQSAVHATQQLAPHAAASMSLGTATITISSATLNIAALTAGAGAAGPKGALAAGAGGAAASTQLSTSTPGYTSPDTAAAGIVPPGGETSSGVGAAAGEAGGGALGQAMAGFGYGQDMLGLAKQLGVKLPGIKLSPGGMTNPDNEDVTAGMNAGKSGVNFAGMASGAMGLYGAAMSDGGFGGAMGGAMSGAQFGSFAGPIGTAVGAAGGFVLGLFGFGGRAKAKAYYNKQVKPHLAQTEDQYNTGRMDYLSAYADLEQLDIEARKTVSQMGWGAGAVYSDTIRPAIRREESKITAEEKAGRSKVSMSAAQFHWGGEIRGFGDLATSDDEGFIHARRGEVVINPVAARTNAPVLSAIHSGADLPRLLGGAQPQRLPVQRSTELNITVHAIDARGVAQFLDENKHKIRSAINDSYQSYAGGSDL